MNRNDEFAALLAAYKNTDIPSKGAENMKKLIASERRRKRRSLRVWAASAVAVVAILVALPNVSMAAAETLGSLPVVGKVFQVVTFRTWEYEEERFEAHVEVPEIVADSCPEAVAEINAEVDALAQEYIGWFEETAELGESYAQLDIRSEVVADTENWFSLKVFIFQGAGSGYQQYRLYNIYKPTGQRMELRDLFANDGYIDAISQDIIRQMKTQMAQDENIIYWVDSEMPEWDFTAVSETQNFYVTAEGDIVILFDEYEVAPGYMGALQFTVDGELVESFLAEGIQLR